MVAHVRVSIDEEDLAAQMDARAELGVGASRIYMEKD